MRTLAIALVLLVGGLAGAADYTPLNGSAMPSTYAPLNGLALPRPVLPVAATGHDCGCVHGEPCTCDPETCACDKSGIGCHGASGRSANVAMVLGDVPVNTQTWTASNGVVQGAASAPGAPVWCYDAYGRLVPCNPPLAAAVPAPVRMAVSPAPETVVVSAAPVAGTPVFAAAAPFTMAAGAPVACFDATGNRVACGNGTQGGTVTAYYGNDVAVVGSAAGGGPVRRFFSRIFRGRGGRGGCGG